VVGGACRGALVGGIVIGAGIAQQLIRRVGVRNVAIGGIALATAVMAVLTQLPVHGSYVGDLLVGLLPMSIGMGLTFVPITLLGTDGVSGDDAGLASGLFNTAQQVGGSLGLAIRSTLAASQTSSLLHGADAHATAAALAARVSGYHVAFAAAAIMLDAAEAVFCERGLDVGVGDIAARAGRATPFRNFASKEDLIAAIVVERMSDAVTRGRELLDAPDAVQALFGFIDDVVGRQQVDRALFEAVADAFLANEDIRAAHAEIVGVLDQLLVRAQATGTVRSDVGALDVLMLVKGVCQAASAFQQVDPQIGQRHLDLVRAALTAPEAARPLRGRTPTLEDVER
jgi:AcrR family transcriptional regulator